MPLRFIQNNENLKEYISYNLNKRFRHWDLQQIFAKIIGKKIFQRKNSKKVHIITNTKFAQSREKQQIFRIQGTATAQSVITTIELISNQMYLLLKKIITKFLNIQYLQLFL